MKEWPLILFTLATQFACGLTLAAVLCDATGSGAEANLMRPLATAIFPLVAAGMLLSVAHLGRPGQWWRAVVNLERSRLSREVILTAVYGLLALVYSGFWWMGRTEGRLALGFVAGAAGIVAVISAAAVYTVPTRPVWNSGWVPASFLGTAVLFGGLAPTLVIPWRGDTDLLRLFLGGGAAGSILLLIAALWMAARSPVREKAFWLGCHVTLAGLLPIVLALGVWPEQRVGIAPFAWPVLAVVLFGAAIGRALMYWLGTRSAPF